MDLKTLRKRKGLTQEEAADVIGLSRRGYQNLEAGVYKKKDSSTLRYAIAKLETIPDPHKKAKALSLTNIARQVEEIVDGEEVDFVYFAKNGSEYVFILATDMDDLSLFSLEEELSVALGAEVTMTRFSSLIEEKENAVSFFSKARRVYPSN